MTRLMKTKRNREKESLSEARRRIASSLSSKTEVKFGIPIYSAALNRDLLVTVKGYHIGIDGLWRVQLTLSDLEIRVSRTVPLAQLQDRVVEYLQLMLYNDVAKAAGE